MGDKTVNVQTGRDENTWKELSFELDKVYNGNCETHKIYDSSIKKIVTNFFQGYNATILAYGQTGCGKSFSMYGAGSNTKYSNSTGIVGMSLNDIFQMMDSNTECAAKLSMNMFEIYNEEVKDLLTEKTELYNKRDSLGGFERYNIYQDPKWGMQVSDLKTIQIRNITEAINTVFNGSSKRSVAKTNLNDSSSRSHVIVTLLLEQDYIDSETGHTGSKVFSKLNLVDLAGSERQKKAETEGVRLVEANKINLSLSALGNVINALAKGETFKKSHIPYRSSKLTRVLQDALGGNAYCTMLACISADPLHSEESISTLRYASRAKNVKNQFFMSISNTQESLIKKYQHEIAKLKEIIEKENMNLETGGKGLDSEIDSDSWKAKYMIQVHEKNKLEKELKLIKKTTSIADIGKNKNIENNNENYYKELYLKECSKNRSLKNDCKKLDEDLNFERTQCTKSVQCTQIVAKLYETLLNEVTRKLPRSCNYHRLSEIINQCIYDAEFDEWNIPSFKLKNQSLPYLNEGTFYMNYFDFKDDLEIATKDDNSTEINKNSRQSIQISSIKLNDDWILSED
ncbi:MAG: Kinesin-like protein kif3c [Paramarteilia canceri]